MTLRWSLGITMKETVAFLGEGQEVSGFYKIIIDKFVVENFQWEHNLLYEFPMSDIYVWNCISCSMKSFVKKIYFSLSVNTALIIICSAILENEKCLTVLNGPLLTPDILWLPPYSCLGKKSANLTALEVIFTDK